MLNEQESSQTTEQIHKLSYLPRHSLSDKTHLYRCALVQVHFRQPTPIYGHNFTHTYSFTHRSDINASPHAHMQVPSSLPEANRHARCRSMRG